MNANGNTKALTAVNYEFSIDFSALVNHKRSVLCREFRDLKRNQTLLRELVSRRGLPVLDNIPLGLQRTRAILAGTSERPTPHNIAARLM